MKKEVKRFDEVQQFDTSNLQSWLTFDEVKDPDADFWCICETDLHAGVSNESFVPFRVKRKAVELYNLLDRSREEKNLIMEEMRNTCDYFSSQHNIISQFLIGLANEVHVLDVECGIEMFTRKKLLTIESTLLQLQNQFSAYIAVTMPNFHTINNLDLENDSDSTVVEEEETVIVSGEMSDSLDEGSDEEYDSEDDGHDVIQL